MYLHQSRWSLWLFISLSFRGRILAFSLDFFLMHELALFMIHVSYLNQDPCATVWTHFTSISVLQLHQIPLGRRELVPGTRLGCLGGTEMGRKEKAITSQALSKWIFRVGSSGRQVVRNLPGKTARLKRFLQGTRRLGLVGSPQD